MKALLLFLAVSLLASPAFAQGEEPALVPATYNTVYVPGGFDSNDHVQFVGEGAFRSSCYRPADTQVTVDHEKHEILLGPRAYEYGGICLQVVLPFDRVIDIGILGAGTYAIRLASDGSALGKVSIKRSLTDQPDDYLYAPVSQAFFRQKGEKSAVYLTGEFSNSCMKLEEVRVTLEPKVIVLQPIASIHDRADCEAGKFPFEKIVEVNDIESGRYLLHVRSMNSKAINTLVDVK